MGREINDSRFRAAEFKRQTYRATLERGTTMAELRDPQFWRMLSAKIQAGDLIEASWEDGSGFTILYVRAIAGANRLIVVPIAGGVFRDEADEDETLTTLADLALLPGSNQADVQDGVRVEWAGDHELWRVVLEKDSAILKTKLPTQGEARRQRTNYLKTLGRAAA